MIPNNSNENADGGRHDHSKFTPANVNATVTNTRNHHHANVSPDSDAMLTSNNACQSASMSTMSSSHLCNINANYNGSINTYSQSMNIPAPQKRKKKQRSNNKKHRKRHMLPGPAGTLQLRNNNNNINNNNSTKNTNTGNCSSNVSLHSSRKQSQQQQQQQQQQHQRMIIYDDSTATDGTDDTDDGLGYSLPNLPVYFSDAESTEDPEVDFETSSSSSSSSLTATSSNNSSNMNSMKKTDLTSTSGANTVTSTATAAVTPNTVSNVNPNNYHNNKYSPYNNEMASMPMNSKQQQQQQGVQPNNPPMQQGQSPPYQYQMQQGMQPYHVQQQQSQSQGSNSNQSYQQQQQQQYPQQGQYSYSSQQQPQPQVPYNYNYPPQAQPHSYNNPNNMYNNINGPSPIMSQPPQQQQQQQQNQQYGPSPWYSPGGYGTNTPAGYYQQPIASNNGFAPQPFITQPQQMRNQYNTSHPSVTTAASSSASFNKLNQKNTYHNMKKDEDENSGNNINSIKNNKMEHVQKVIDTATAVSTTSAGTHKVTMEQQQNMKIQSVYTQTKQPRITFDSIQKLVFFSLGNILLCYCAVSPRTLGIIEYNEMFKKNVQTASLVLIAPILEIMCVVGKGNDINSLITTFYASATLGCFFSLLLEILLTTFIRLAVFCIWEPSIFSLTPTVPLIVLPWTLRDHKYRPKRITLFVADFTTTCIAAPIIEEYVKLKVMQLSTNLPRNFYYRKLGRNELSKKRRRTKKKKTHVLEEIAISSDEKQVSSINSYVSHMLTASLGLKLSDSIKRTMMYTKKGDVHKQFYALMRGFYPVHELCGTMTALELAKRNVLGLDTPLWRILFPSVFIHSMANLKGMKPLFKWNSKTPWTEIQLAPFNLANDSSTLSQMFTKGFAKFMWFVVLSRVFGYCVKNYYMISRLAIKRTTIFAGKNAAFNAEIAAADALRRTKKD